MTAKVRMLPDALDKLKKDPSTGHLLRKVAEKVAPKVKAPKGYKVSIRAGVGRRHGAFSQVMMEGERALFVEFGTRHQTAQAPIRNALQKTKGVTIRGS